MPEPTSGQMVKEIIGAELTDQEVSALVQGYATLALSVAAFPGADLKRVEPPLRSVPGPRT